MTLWLKVQPESTVVALVICVTLGWRKIHCWENSSFWTYKVYGNYRHRPKSSSPLRNCAPNPDAALKHTQSTKGPPTPVTNHSETVWKKKKKKKKQQEKTKQRVRTHSKQARSQWVRPKTMTANLWKTIMQLKREAKLRPLPLQKCASKPMPHSETN